ncbi:hypothetical protein HMPREF0765_4652 [Sphingobacterium spiritivorum ATCC 33300]|uniref:DUF6438 domain-containing protein n=1 Tax=Sphingobacterium spiritivorum ATCC 33300 TaxID=525372 RepID=C2G4Z6_SPHSI|nr:DUF6438 domain-containing protein [Sphingobacterium spiritivorum]EEI89747.1 hypothetical protein HMPREF0765_4652 [Sphingobacterium spiritivorum ATCC 33300]QQS94729.1 hypothetical protein I6J03_15220 [Sphingobacterium spiritivorum]
MKYLLFSFTVLLFISCKSYKTGDSVNKKYEIEEVSFSRKPCFGTCPVFVLKISKNGTAQLDADNFLKNGLKGKYVTQISTGDLYKIMKQLNELQFPELKDDYGNRLISDLPSVHLEIRYQNDKIKKIRDYGNRGTAELEKLYKTIDEILYAQKWVPAQ